MINEEKIVLKNYLKYDYYTFIVPLTRSIAWKLDIVFFLNAINYIVSDKVLKRREMHRYVKLRLVFLGGMIEKTGLLPILVLFRRIQVKTPIPEYNTLPSELQVIITGSPLSGCQQLV